MQAPPGIFLFFYFFVRGQRFLRLCESSGGFVAGTACGSAEIGKEASRRALASGESCPLDVHKRQLAPN